MPERPLLLLPKPVPVAKARRGGGGGKTVAPDMVRQVARIAPQFQALQTAFQSRAITLAASPGTETAELLLVIETAGPVQHFFRAVSKIPGLKWQFEWDDEVAPDEDFFDGANREKPLQGYAYLMLGNQQAVQQMLSFWQRWQNGQDLPDGCAPWKNAFKFLRAIRPWSEQDRIRNTGFAEYAIENLTFERASVPCEAELCFRESTGQRQLAVARVTRHIESLGGTVVSEFAHDHVRYHGLLFHLPSQRVKDISELASDIALLRSHDVFLLRPAGQSITRPELQEDEPAVTTAPPQAAAPVLPPVAALLDGMPLQNHALLRDRIIVVNPEAEYEASRREHGTQMASAIIHGDIGANEPAIARPLVVRPIMIANSHPDGRESLPGDKLAVDLVHRAVRELVAGDAPIASTVRIISFSIADGGTQFDHAISSWARMLDWLAHEHNLIFIVSAGNHGEKPIATGVQRAQWSALTPAARQAAVLQTINREVRERRLRPPSEAANVLTIGAIAEDANDADHLGAGSLPYESRNLPAHYSACGLGYRRMVKPELFVTGGRLPIRPQLPESGENAVFDGMPNFHRAAGIRVASPGAGNRIDETICARGTSHAAALTTRAAIQLWDTIEALGVESDTAPSSEYFPVLLKAALVHGASWREAREALHRALGAGLTPGKFRQLAQRLIGFGIPDFSRSSACAERRATLIGYGSLSADEAQEFRIPLPHSLSGKLGLRRVTVTLAYLSPINARSQKYIAANLWLTFGFKRQNQGQILHVERTDCDDHAAVRGTVQHEIFEGDKASVFANDEFLPIRVNAAEQAAGFTRPVRYGLFVSVEVGEKVPVLVYDEIAARIRAPIGVAALSA